MRTYLLEVAAMWVYGITLVVGVVTLLSCPAVDDDDGVDDDDVTVDDDDTSPDDDDVVPDDDDVIDDDDVQPNRPPDATDDFASTIVGLDVWIDVLDNDSDPDGDPLEIELLSHGQHGTTSRSAGGVLYSPDAGFVGADRFDYLVGDPDGLNDGAEVFVDVSCGGGFELLSFTPDGAVPEASSRAAAASDDARFVAFESDASDLVDDDTNGFTDIFVLDRATGLIERVSVDGDGVEADNASYDPAISADGRWIAYSSYASNLVPGDTNGSRDVFLWDRDAGSTVRVSVNSDGTQATGSSYGPSVSGDGSAVAFTSYAYLDPVVTFPTTDVWVYERLTGDIELISESLTGIDGIQTSGYASISDDGDRVAFSSMAWDLVSADSDAFVDIFVRDREAGTTSRINLPIGVPAADGHSNQPVLSADGTTVAFLSQASNLVAGDLEGVNDIFVVTLASGTVERVSVDSLEVPSTHESLEARLSGDGRYVAFLSEGALDATGAVGVRDLYVRDRVAGQTAAASVGCEGQANLLDVGVPIDLSDDGAGLIFQSSEEALLAPIPDDNAGVDLFWVPNPLALP